MNSTTSVARRKRALRIAATAAAFVCAASADAAVSLLTNGNFEIGALSPWNTEPIGASAFDFEGVVSFDTSGSGTSLTPKFQAGSIDTHPAGGGLFQMFSAPDAGSYSFAIDVASQHLGGCCNADGGTFTLKVDGAVFDNFVVGTAGADETQRQHLSGSAVLTAGSHRFEIDLTRSFTIPGSNVFLYVDNALAPVPEPASWVMFPAGLGMLGWKSARRAR